MGRMNAKSKGKQFDRRVKDLIMSKGYACHPKSGKPVNQNKSIQLPYRFKNKG